MSFRVVLCVAAMSIGCTAIRPLDPLDAATAHPDANAGDGDLSIDAGNDAATTSVDAGLDAFADDTNVDAPMTDANVDASSVPVDANVDTGCGVEVCGGGDEDCDGMVDEAGASGSRAYYADVDSDSYGDDTTLMMLCRSPTMGVRFVMRGGDCDDTNRQVNPGRSEICNGIDDNCNGMIDDGLAGCSITCTHATYLTHTYLFCTDRVTQMAAATNCAGMGYHLVNVGDAAENTFVQMEAVALAIGTGGPAQGAWIGLTQTGTMMYQWTDGTTATYFAWDTAMLEPNGTGTCVRMRSSSGLWADNLCTAIYPYICEAP